MSELKVGDLVKWNIKKGINGQGRIIAIEEDDGFKRYRVIVTKNLNYKGQFGDNKLRKGEIGYPINPKKIR